MILPNVAATVSIMHGIVSKSVERVLDTSLDASMKLLRYSDETAEDSHAYFWPVLRKAMEMLVQKDESFLTDGECTDPSCTVHTPLPMWVAGQRGLEFMMQVRSREEFHADYHALMHQAAEVVDSPQHAMDVIMALANMLNLTASDEDVEDLGKLLLNAEAEMA